MKVLFIHQNFPGQYIHIVQRLARQGGHQLVALGINPLDQSRKLPNSLQHFRYRLERAILLEDAERGVRGGRARCRIRCNLFLWNVYFPPNIG